MDLYSRILTELAFQAQVRGDAKRTVFCEPDRVDEIRAAVEERGYGDTVTVRASPYCPAGRLFVIDDGAIEAGFRQALQRSIRALYR